MASVFKDWEKRKEEMSQVAYRLGMNFSANDEWTLLTRLKGFRLFQTGRNRRIFNLMEKKSDFLEEQFHIFDYQYIIQAGNTPRRFHQTVFFVQSKYLGLPEFLMKPENFFHKIGSYLGMQDIDFKENKKYSGQYLLKGEDEDLIRKMMEGNLLKYFTVEKNWNVEGVGYFLILYKKKQLLTPSVIEDFHNKGMEIYSLLKDQNEKQAF